MVEMLLQLIGGDGLMPRSELCTAQEREGDEFLVPFQIVENIANVCDPAS